MKTPFSSEQFFDVFKTYNEALFPWQFALYLLAVISFYLSIKPTAISDKLVSAILSTFWLWMGIVYHLTFFTAINPAAYLFAFLFILQGILFFIYGVYKNNISFRIRPDLFGISALVIILYALIGYPVLGYYYQHNYPYSPTFGLPCPTTIFTLGMLLLTVRKFPMILLVIPLLWSFIGFSAVLNFGVAEDAGLLLAGVITTSLLIFRNHITLQHGLTDLSIKAKPGV